MNTAYNIFFIAEEVLGCSPNPMVERFYDYYGHSIRSTFEIYSIEAVCMN